MTFSHGTTVTLHTFLIMADIETEQQPDYEVSMSIGTLTTLMLGYKTAEKLHVMDKIQASDEAVEHLDDILFHRIPYVSDYI